MATAHNTDRFDDLKARVAGLGYELITNDAGEQFVLDSSGSGIEVVFIHRTDADDDLEDWLASEENRRRPPTIHRGDYQGGYQLPAPLVPAFAIYEKLMQDGDAMPTGDVLKYLAECEVWVARTQRGEDEGYVLVEANLSRRGLSYLYAAKKLHYVLCGAEELKPAELPAVAAPSEKSAPANEGGRNPDLGELYDLQDLVAEIEQLAKDGQESDDPKMVLAVVKRLATEAVGYMSGELYDRLSKALRAGAA